jgi:hypothetical protein
MGEETPEIFNAIPKGYSARSGEGGGRVTRDGLDCHEPQSGPRHSAPDLRQGDAGRPRTGLRPQPAGAGAEDEANPNARLRRAGRHKSLLSLACPGGPNNRRRGRLRRDRAEHRWFGRTGAPIFGLEPPRDHRRRSWRLLQDKAADFEAIVRASIAVVRTTGGCRSTIFLSTMWPRPRKRRAISSRAAIAGLIVGSGGPERSRIGSYLQALGEFGYAPQVVSCGEFNQEGGYHAAIGFSMLRTARPPYSLATT